MLIYNINKEFAGITEETLRRVGYNTASELQEDAVDFADLFENRPGFLHNFKNFSWIDFIIHSEQENTKARIRCNGKIYECGFKVGNFYFTQTGTNKPGFIVELMDLIIIGDDDGTRSREMYEPEAPAALQMPDLMQRDSSDEDLAVSEPIAEPVIPDIPVESIEIPDMIDDVEPLEEFNETIERLDMDMTEDAPPMELDIPLEEESVVAAPVVPKVSPVPAPTQISTLDLETPADYTYDPSIAADELGLPSDLIDEFVGDFIVQATKFRPDIEEAINTSDFDNVQILSHKLKGVAANLRIEDALEVLTFINSSKDVSKLKEYLDYLYQIIHRLEFGNDSLPLSESNSIEDAAQAPQGDDDLYSFDLVNTAHSEPAMMSEPEESAMDITQEVPQEDMIDIPQEMLEIPDVDEREAETSPLGHIDTNKFDIHEAAANLDIPMETLKSYVDDFVDQANELKSELESALTSKNLQEVKNLATQLKGMSDSLNMNHASELLSVLQTTEDVQVAIENAKELFVFIREL